MNKKLYVGKVKYNGNHYFSGETIYGKKVFFDDEGKIYLFVEEEVFNGIEVPVYKEIEVSSIELVEETQVTKSSDPAIQLSSKEKIEKAWNLVHEKYPNNNEEIQLVRYGLRQALYMIEKEIPKAVLNTKYLEVYRCPFCESQLQHQESRYCENCGQRIKWQEEN